MFQDSSCLTELAMHLGEVGVSFLDLRLKPRLLGYHPLIVLTLQAAISKDGDRGDKLLGLHGSQTQGNGLLAAIHQDGLGRKISAGGWQGKPIREKSHHQKVD